MLLPTDATPHRATLSDVLLLLFDRARERTSGQYRDLLEHTGWRLGQVVASPGPMSIIQASVKQPARSSSLNWLQIDTGVFPRDQKQSTPATTFVARDHLAD